MLDAFKVEYKSYYITEHETDKAHRFLKIVLAANDSNNTNQNAIIAYIAKMEIEISLLEQSKLEYKRRWLNSENMYISPESTD